MTGKTSANTRSSMFSRGRLLAILPVQALWLWAVVSSALFVVASTAPNPSIIPFLYPASLTGLAAAETDDVLFAVTDAPNETTILEIDAASGQVAAEVHVKDTNGVLSNSLLMDDGSPNTDWIDRMINSNAELTVNFNPRGISVARTTDSEPSAAFWIVSKAKRSIVMIDGIPPHEDFFAKAKPNLLLLVDRSTGVVLKAIRMLQKHAELQAFVHGGFDGVAQDIDRSGRAGWVVCAVSHEPMPSTLPGGIVVSPLLQQIAFQNNRARAQGYPSFGDSHILTRLDLYNAPSSDGDDNAKWKYVFYLLDPRHDPLPQGKIVVSDIAALGEGDFLVLERDSQEGDNATVRRLYKIHLGNDIGALEDGTIIVEKELVRDFLQDARDLGGKADGLALSPSGRIWVGTDKIARQTRGGELVGTGGEQQLLDFGALVCSEKFVDERRIRCGAPTSGIIQQCGLNIFEPFYEDNPGCIHVSIEETYSCNACSATGYPVDVKHRKLCRASIIPGASGEERMRFNVTRTGGPGTHISYQVQACTPGKADCKSIQCTVCVDKPSRQCSRRLTLRRGSGVAAGGIHGRHAPGGHGGGGYLHQQCQSELSPEKSRFSCGD